MANLQREDIKPEEVEFSLLQSDLSKNNLLEPIVQNDSEGKKDFLNSQELAEEQRNPIKGIMWMFCYCACISTSFVIMKILYDMNPHLTFVDHQLTKAALPIIVHSTYAYYNRIDLMDMDRETAIVLFFRVLFGVGGMAMVFVAVNYISVSLITIITNLTPINLALLSYLFLNEKITKIEVGLIVLGFWGIVLICMQKPHDSNNNEHYLFGVILAGFASIAMASAYTCLRKISTKLTPIYPTFYFFVGSFINSAVAMLYDSDYVPKFSKYTLIQVVLFFIGSVVGILVQTFISLGYKYEKAARLQPYQYLQVVFSIIADLLIFKLTFTYLQMLGMFMISICLLIPAFMKYYGYLS